MITAKKKICIECGNEDYIFSKKRCKRCASKTFKQIQPKRMKIKPRKPTGERDLFLMIWELRPHVCTHCETPLGHEAKAGYFAHIKPKSTHPELRLDENNIRLLCLECHHAYDMQGKKSFEKRSFTQL